MNNGIRGEHNDVEIVRVIFVILDLRSRSVRRVWIHGISDNIEPKLQYLTSLECHDMNFCFREDQKTMFTPK